MTSTNNEHYWFWSFNGGAGGKPADFYAATNWAINKLHLIFCNYKFTTGGERKHALNDGKLV